MTKVGGAAGFGLPDDVQLPPDDAEPDPPGEPDPNERFTEVVIPPEDPPEDPPQKPEQ